MEHLALEIFDLNGKGGSKYATLEEDASITITASSEIFASGDVWSYTFTLNTRANAHIFGTSGEMHGTRLHEQINKRRARLWVDGLPLYTGYLKLGDEVGMSEDGNVEVAFESGQKTFDEKIEGGKANQVPLMSDVRFGIALWRKRWTHVGYKMTAEAVLSDGRRTNRVPLTRDLTDEEIKNGVNDAIIEFYNEGEDNPMQEYPRMVFPKGSFKNVDTGETETIDCINTDYPYDDGHPYCNITLCYQKQGYEKYKNENDKTETYNDYSSEPTALRGYETMPANRVNSAPNFYVIYWLRSLMKHLGIVIEENQMMDVEDLRRLFFVNTKCEYKDPKYVRTHAPEGGVKRYKFIDGVRLIGETFGPADIREISPLINTHEKTYCIHPWLTKTSDSGFMATDFTPHTLPVPALSPTDTGEASIDRIVVNVSDVLTWDQTVKDETEDKNSYLHDAIATSDCFPDVDISEVIKALENAFGMRMLFSDNYQRVRIVLLRNLFRDSDIQSVDCDIISNTKTENSTRGFRLTYGNSEDTHFYYKGFADMLPHKTKLWNDTSDKHDYSHWDLSSTYANIIHKISAFDKTCYITPNTGNAFGIKVDKDGKRYEDLHPSIFEYAGFMDAEDGDCTGEKDTIEEISIGFTPAIMNDLNMTAEREGDLTQKFALFVNETMRPRRPDLLDGKDYNNPDVAYDVDTYLYGDNTPEAIKKMKHDGVVKPGEFAITSDMYGIITGLKATFNQITFSYPITQGISPTTISGITIEGHVNEGYRLYLQDNFEPNDKGASPIETHDWGLTLGIMRSSGSDARINYGEDSDDGEGNGTWEIESGKNATVHPDTCDCYGNLWDYNGSIVVRDSSAAIEQLQKLWPNSNKDLLHSSGTTMRDKDTYIKHAFIYTVTTNTGKKTKLLVADHSHDIIFGKDTSRGYLYKLNGMSIVEMFASDAGKNGLKILVEANSSIERRNTLLELERRAFTSDGSKTKPIIIDSNGVGSTEGRISLKLRAEKPNPYFDPKKPESESNRRYLQITDPNLRNRGLADQFYKEYSCWVRNARICKCTVRMELAQLLAIDKTKRVKVGDITGFIKKMQYTVSNNSGLGQVTMEIMYI